MGVDGSSWREVQGYAFNFPLEGLAAVQQVISGPTIDLGVEGGDCNKSGVRVH